MKHNKTIDRLEDLLEQKEEELDELKREVERLKYMLDGSPDGWRVVESIKDDPSLPIPRLEMAFEPSKILWPSAPRLSMPSNKHRQNWSVF